ncbi:GNAT family N-acetyltransferase [Paenibacillus durus]|uniref:GNAT family acetyltransferase n=1 Tax=Paenibacillus durus ATCC 35681 TaxID=1333534 RepID=A0A0F7CH80_PAEDU|nr:GNAT family N-acetyltransferase [Paenibacillus durus]AKG34181.1 GNAT family acetyltransferase [Paenibacillus durus ATCC 35681]
MTILDTDRLIIRRFKAEDWRDLHEYLSRENVVKYEPYGVLTEKESREEALRRSSDSAFWAVCLKETGKMIGNLYFQEQEPKRFQTWVLGYVFHSDYQGNGYAGEACRRLLKYGYETLEIRRVIAMCNPENQRSWKLLERLNFRREGHSLQTGYFKYDKDGNPIWHDTFLYALLRTEWGE